MNKALLIFGLLILCVIGVPFFFYVGLATAFSGGSGPEVIVYPLIFLIFAGWCFVAIWKKNSTNDREQVVNKAISDSGFGLTNEDRITEILRRRGSSSVQDISEAAHISQDDSIAIIRKLLSQSRVKQELHDGKAFFTLKEYIDK